MVGPTDGDWSFVQHERCDGCGFDPAQFKDRDLGHGVKALGDRWVVFVDAFERRADGKDLLRTRPEAPVWSALEYACHLRDVLALFTERVERTLQEDRPELGWWDHEAAVEEQRYFEQDPGAVAGQIAGNADDLADALRRVPKDGWQRPATRLGRKFTVAGLARFALHEGYHHLMDAERAAQAALGQR